MLDSHVHPVDAWRLQTHVRARVRAFASTAAAPAHAHASGPGQVEWLQRTVGNQAVVNLLRSTTRQVQRFEEGEHLKLGEAGTRGAHGETQMVQLADDYRISYGEMLAMAGDHFASIDQMRDLAAKKGTGAGTREELEYVRQVKIHGNKTGKFSDGARKAADKRYYDLALRNRSHFPNPVAGDEKRSTVDKGDDTAAEYKKRFGTKFDALESQLPPNAVSGYHHNHVRALFEAYLAGMKGASVESAMAVDAFGAHYLTDAFSGGHLMTPRASINEHWNALVPMFNINLKGFIANEIAKKLQGHYKVLTTDQLYQDVPIPWKDSALTTVTQKLDARGSLTFGDVVSGAVHDFYNENGATADIQGKKVNLKGDNHLGEGDEEKFATRAVHASAQDVIKAWELGSKRRDASAIKKRLAPDGMFAAEKLLPKVRPLSEQAGPVDWNFPSVDKLLGDPGFGEALRIFAKNKAGEFQAVANELGGVQGKAFEDAIIAKLRAKATALQLLQNVIDWVPDTGGGVFGHNQDDNALDYFKAAKKRGNLATLTYKQKEKIIGDLLDGATIGDEEDAIVELLKLNDADARQLIHRFGWGKLHSDIDDWGGSQFSRNFPKKVYAK